jgi:hypothetical protein
MGMCGVLSYRTLGSQNPMQPKTTWWKKGLQPNAHPAARFPTDKGRHMITLHLGTGPWESITSQSSHTSSSLSVATAKAASFSSSAWTRMHGPWFTWTPSRITSSKYRRKAWDFHWPAARICASVAPQFLKSCQTHMWTQGCPAHKAEAHLCMTSSEVMSPKPAGFRHSQSAKYLSQAQSCFIRTDLRPGMRSLW